MQMIFDEYEEYVRKYKQEYGDRTLVLLECGSFYEIYNDGSGLVDMREIGDLLNIQVSRRNKQITQVNRTNYEMAGFPSHSLKKFVQVLLQNQYTVVIVSQVTPPPNPKRAVTEVISPGTTLEPNASWDSNELMVIYLEENEGMKCGLPILSIGCSGIDVTTGKSYTYEVTSDHRDITYPLDEVYRMLTLHKPREVYIMSDELTCIHYDKVREHLELDRCYVHDYLGRMHGDLQKIAFQREVLTKVYPKTGLLTSIEFVGLERKPYALISFVKLIEFALQHNENLLQDILPPFHEEEMDVMMLSYNCAHQLDIISSSDRRNGTLLHILNQCKTSIGKRYMRSRLLAPMKNATHMEASYDMVEKCLEHDLYKHIREDLQYVYDLERLFRRISLNVIHPLELAHVHTSLQMVETASEKFPMKDQHAKVKQWIQNTLRYITLTFDIDRLSMYNRENIDAYLFHRGVFKEMDELVATMQEKRNAFVNIMQMLNKENEYFRLDNTEKDGYFYVTTSKRWQEVKNGPPIEWKGKTFQWSDYHVKTLTNNVKITHPYLEKLNLELVGLEKKQANVASVHFRECVEVLHDMCKEELPFIIDRIQIMDFMTTNAFNAFKYKLCRPTTTSATKSYVECKGLRHLIVECLHQQLEYVTNDIQLGDGLCDGMLLYGINSAGKSSLMKSIGLAVIMAQAGMYAPCQSMHFAPYDKVFTRIFSSDDIMKGHSTFTKEILELRNILKRSTANSLIIGDELCSGTESISAISIVSAGVHTLAAKGASFVFATHLHDLVDIEEVRTLRNVQVRHLSVRYDEELRKLVYDRKLKEGNGSTMYGIEVCKSLDLDPEFLRLANIIRQRYIGANASMKQSTYNSSVIVHMCGVCKTARADEVHHIHPQMLADESGYIGHYHKNAQHNLIPLCEKCHLDIHHGRLEVTGYIQTADGIEPHIQNTKKQVCTDDEEKEHLAQITQAFEECTSYKLKKDKYKYIQEKTGFTLYKIKKLLNTSS